MADFERLQIERVDLALKAIVAVRLADEQQPIAARVVGDGRVVDLERLAVFSPVTLSGCHWPAAGIQAKHVARLRPTDETPEA